MTNNADKEKDDRIKATDAQPDQDQQSLDTEQGIQVLEAAIEGAEMVSDVIEETLPDDPTDENVGQDNVAADRKEDQTSSPSDQSMKDSEIPNADIHQTAKLTSRLGLLPLIFFSILSGGVGFIAAYLVFFLGIFSLGSSSEDIRASLSKVIASNTNDVERVTTTVQRQEMDIVQAIKKIDALDAQVIFNREMAEAQAPFGIRMQTLEDQLNSIELHADSITKRIWALENKPIGEIVSESVIGAYNNEVTALQSSIQAQRDQVDKLIAQASAKETQALEISQTTMARIALAEVQTALEKGMPFVTELNEFAKLTGRRVPPKLSELADTGAVTIAELNAQFPPFARKALTAQRAGSSENRLSAGWADFLKSQFQARSVSPKEGNDADAVLSRAEDAVRQGNLAKALEELSNLTSPAKDKMAQWSNQAVARLAAADAVKLLLVSIEE
ncbi:MAG: hypothetical protein P8I83_07880 [Paracoccaceae bacterium]|nr:hypothetical protein [Paracoccaceae bacterium]